MGNGLLCALEARSLAALGHEADVMREYQHWPLRPMSRRKVGKVDWQVFDQLPAIHGIQFFCDAMTAGHRWTLRRL